MEKPSFINHVIKWGVIVGLVGIVVSLLTYVLNESLLVKWWYGLLILAINVALIIYAGIEYRKLLGGYMSYKDAFLVTLLVMLFAGIIGQVFNIVLYFVIDPDLPNRLVKLTLEQTEQMLTRFGTPQESIDQTMEKMKTDMPARFTMAGQFKAFVTWGLGMTLVISAILALIVRKKEPEIQM
jgi:hypothetical protein